VAAVITYAGNAVGDVETARRIKAPILMIRGSRDRLFEGAKAAKFEERLKAAQKQVELVGVDGGHALADPTRDDYSATGDWVAFLRVRDFLKAHLAR
jgi:dienelactone hydrolase